MRLKPSRPRNGFHDFLRTPLDRQQIGGCRRIRHAPALLPVFQREKRNTIRRGEVMLRHPERKTDGFHVRQLDLGHAQPAHRFASRVLGRLLHALDQFLAKLAHRSFFRLPVGKLLWIGQVARERQLVGVVEKSARPSLAAAG